MAAAVRPDKILKDLAKLWVDLGKQDSEKDSAGVLRACAMTLIAAVEQESDAAAVGETLGELMHQHPSRAIVLRVCPDPGAALDARVFAQCWMPFGRRQQICCEQIEITAAPSRVEDLPNLVLGLTVPDLPVVLWCRGEPIRNLFPLANKIILDTERSGAAHPTTGIEQVRQFTREGYNVADLAWTRLTRWRDSIAQMFDNQAARQHLAAVDTVVVTHSGAPAPEPLPSRLVYLKSWLERTMPSPFRLLLQASATDSGRTIGGIELRGPGFSACVTLEGAAAVLRVDDLTRRIPFPKLSDYELMREELGILGIDPVFRRCLE